MKGKITGIMKGKMKRVVCLGILPTSVGIASYYFTRILFEHDFLNLEICKIVFLFPLILVIFSSYYIKKWHDYLEHEFSFSIIVALFILATVDLSNILGRSDPGPIIMQVFSKIAPERNAESLRYLLSASSQSLAALFGIVFSLTIICAQLYVHLFDVAQISKKILKKESTYLLFLFYIFYIIYNILLLKIISPSRSFLFQELVFLDSVVFKTYPSQYEAYILWSLAGTVFCLSLLIPYLLSIARDLDLEGSTVDLLNEAREEDDEEKIDKVEKLASNMKYWHSGGRKSLFAFAKVHLDYFLVDTRSNIKDGTRREIESLMESLNDIIIGDSELKALIEREHLKQARELIRRSQIRRI